MEWSIVRQYDHAAAAWATTQTTCTCVVKNFSIFTTGHTNVTTISGDVTITGTMSASTKGFDIPDPDCSKPAGRRLRHWCVEGDAAGNSLLFRRQITAPKAGLVDLIMPNGKE